VLHKITIQAKSTHSTTAVALLTVASLHDGHYKTELEPNSLETIHHLLTLIRERTAIPLVPHAFDQSRTIIPHPYLIFFESETPTPVGPDTTVIPLPDACKGGLIGSQDKVAIDLQLGMYLAQMHAIQNDWFGRPHGAGSPQAQAAFTPMPDEPEEPSSYSWQETFTHRLEALLQHMQHHQPATTDHPDRILIHKLATELPYIDIRRYLARAIASFLFDDAEVPTLVSFTASESDIRVAIPKQSSLSSLSGIMTSTTATIVSFQPNLTYALWADPLLETFFLPPGPSDALQEGYVGAGGGRLIVFPRQKTKRLWYTFYLALVVLMEWDRTSDALEQHNEKIRWAAEVSMKCVKALKDAPCY
jgi:hypothetical protein